jgi:2-desacetyl-2-hydroxyethyl bacteriochlorophyllide A dehydrogenase
MVLMDALVCVAPGELELAKRPTPVRGDGEALVKPRRIGICGTDYHIFEGKHPFLNYPRVMGHELAVEVLEAPSGSNIAPGEIMVVNPYLSCGTCIACRQGKPNCCTRIAVLGVHRDGGMAGTLTLPAANLIPAEGLSLDACATVEFLAIGAHAVRRAQIVPGEHVLVVGAGPIGLGVAFFAQLAGAGVTILDRDGGRIESAIALQAAAAGIFADADTDASIAAATNAEGFAVVFDATGNTQSMERGFDFVAHAGRYILVSVVKTAIVFSDADFHRKEMTLLGSRNALMADFETVIAAISEGVIPVDRLVTHRTTLGQAVRDLPRWANAKSGLIKAMIEVE